MEQFDVLQTLGRGSFGVVRKVRRKADGKTLVVKEMDYGAADEKQKEQIVAEVNILRELRHPFIVRYYDRIVDRRRTRLHIVMEHCSTDLARVVKTRRLRGEYLEEQFLWNLMSQVVLALEVCHGRVGKGGVRMPIIHRDLKPDNVFLTSDHVVKLGDFGLARELSGGQLAETSVGTPYYMSPELINEQRYDERTDVWSLGCLMYEAASLNRPFNAQNQLALAMKINAGKVAPIPSRYSPGLFATIEWMLNKTRHKRPRMVDLMKVPALQLPLRENRLLVREFQLQQSYVRRIRTLKSREIDIERRESELAAEEARLRRLSEQALSLNGRRGQPDADDKRLEAGEGSDDGSGGGYCLYDVRSPSMPAAAAAAVAVRNRQERLHCRLLGVQQQQQQQQSTSSSIVPLPRREWASPSVVSCRRFGVRAEGQGEGESLAGEDNAAAQGHAQRAPQKITEGQGGGLGQGREGAVNDPTLAHRKSRPVGSGDSVQESESGGRGGGERTATASAGLRPEERDVSSSIGTLSKPRQDFADAATAVLDYASLVLHSSPHSHIPSGGRERRGGSGGSGSTTASNAGGREEGRSRGVQGSMVSSGSGEMASQGPRAAGGSGAGCDVRGSEGVGYGGERVQNGDEAEVEADTDVDTAGTTTVLSPPRRSPCLDDTVPMDSHAASPTPVPPPPVVHEKDEIARYHRSPDTASPLAGSGGGSGAERRYRRRERGGWEDGGEFRSTRTEAVMAAGRRARESYAGFMETIAAARDLGTWAAPTSSANQTGYKENTHVATAFSYRGAISSTTFRQTPLMELPNGGAGGPVRHVGRCPPAAAAAPGGGAVATAASVAAGAATWRGRYLLAEGGAKEVRVGGSPARRGAYQRSASDVACGGGIGPTPPSPRGPRSGSGGGGGVGWDGGRWREAAAAPANDMYLAAAAAARARRGRLSSRRY